MKRDREGFLYPAVNQNACTGCRKCLAVCPIRHGEISLPSSHESRFYGAKIKDLQVRERSSSGGMFSLLADYVLEHSGVVYGAGFDKEMKVIHKAVFDENELDAIRRSKYVQSELGTIFGDVKTRLIKGQWVLFTGTPCQTEALRLFLGRTYDRLILADLICYGAASPGIWKSYIGYLERRHREKICEYYFRDKRNRDNGHTVSWKGKKEEKAHPLSADPYSQMYFQNLLIRPSCFYCPYCRPDRNSDFTLGDFWGIEKRWPDFDDGMGNSLVIVHTEKGMQIWKILQKRCESFECCKEDAMQPRLQTPTAKPRYRELFMKGYRYLRIGNLIRWMKLKKIPGFFNG